MINYSKSDHTMSSSHRNLDVICVGGCFMDMMVYTERLPVAGETINGTDFMMLCGGKGPNICVMSALLGAQCAFIGRVGKDINGADTFKNFKKYGVNTEFLLETENESTAVITCYVDSEGEPAFASIPGANHRLCPDDIDRAESLISRAKVLVCPKAMKDLRAFLRSFQLAKKHELMTIFNIAPAVDYLDPEFYKVVDIAIVNRLEAERLTNVKVESRDDAEKSLAVLHERGIQKAVLTVGKDGAYCSEKVGGEIVYSKVEAPVIEDVVDCTGSGDAFTGAVAYYLSNHPSLEFKDIVQRSVTIASQTVRKKGCQPSYPAREELEKDLFM